MTNGDQDRLHEYLREQFPELEDLAVAEMVPLARGASNETIRLRLEYRREGQPVAQQCVLRPQRVAGILEPYDIARQYRVMAALQGSAVPVPRLLCLEEAGRVLGTPFFLMEYVDGETPPLLWQSEVGDPRMRSHASTLRRIHEIDWRARGLTFLGDPADAKQAVEEEIDAWLARNRRTDGEIHPRLTSLAGWLRRNNAGRGEPVLIHGDPNPGNYLFRGDEVVGVVDWEMAAISDPRSDLGFYAAIQSLFSAIVGVGSEPGFIRAYEEASGTSVEDMRYFEALGLFKMGAVVLRAYSQWQVLGPYLERALHQRLDELCGPLPAE